MIEQLRVADVLASADHTEIVKAIAENFGSLMKRVRPTATEILTVALEEPQIDDHVKSLIRRVLANLPSLEHAEKRMTFADQRMVAELRGRVAAAKTVQDQIQVLTQARHEYPSKASAIDAARDILEDGAQTIYTTPFWQQSLRAAAASLGVSKAPPMGGVVGYMTVAGADVGGAIAGAIITAPAGAVEGAATGAVVGSVAEAGSELWDWIWS